MQQDRTAEDWSRRVHTHHVAGGYPGPGSYRFGYDGSLPNAYPWLRDIIALGLGDLVSMAGLFRREFGEMASRETNSQKRGVQETGTRGFFG